MLKVFFIGSGKLAGNLARAMQHKDIELAGVYSRTAAHAQKFANTYNMPHVESLHDIPKNYDVYFLAISDGALHEIAPQVNMNGLLVHCSGMMPLSCLNGHVHTGVFWPIQTFSSMRQLSLRDVPVCIESKDENDLRILEVLADKISKKVIQVSEEERQKLHLAAVLVNNFSNHLFTLAQNFLAPGLSFDLLKPLIIETAEKILDLPPQAAQTGPASRKDFVTMASHEALLAGNARLLDIYRLLSLSIMDTTD